MKTLSMKFLTLFFVTLTASVYAQEKQDEKIQKSIEVINEFSGMKENIPAQLMQRAEGIIIIPGLINAGLGIGGKRGKGIAMVKNADGSWSDPVFVTLTGGSIGFQAGVQSVDLVMVFTKRATLKEIANGEFTLGGNVAVAAGPVGRSSSANTDLELDAEVYSYSRSKGLFAGLSVSGSKISVDEDANAAFYSGEKSAATIFNRNGTSSNADVTALKKAVKGI